MFGSKEAILTPECAGGLWGMELFVRLRLIVMMQLLEALVGNPMNLLGALPLVSSRNLVLLSLAGL